MHTPSQKSYTSHSELAQYFSFSTHTFPGTHFHYTSKIKHTTTARYKPFRNPNSKILKHIQYTTLTLTTLILHQHNRLHDMTSVTTVKYAYTQQKHFNSFQQYKIPHIVFILSHDTFTQRTSTPTIATESELHDSPAASLRIFRIQNSHNGRHHRDCAPCPKNPERSDHTIPLSSRRRLWTSSSKISQPPKSSLNLLQSSHCHLPRTEPQHTLHWYSQVNSKNLILSTL